MKSYQVIVMICMLVTQYHVASAQKVSPIPKETQKTVNPKKSTIKKATLKDKMLRLGKRLQPSLQKQKLEQKMLKEDSMHYIQTSHPKKKPIKPKAALVQQTSSTSLTLPSVLPSYFKNLVPDRLSPTLYQWTIKWDQNQSMLNVYVDWQFKAKPQYFLSTFQMNVIRYQWLTHVNRNALKQNKVQHKTRGTLAWKLKKGATDFHLLQLHWQWSPKKLTQNEQKAILSLLKKGLKFPMTGEVKANLTQEISSTLP